MRHFPLVAVWLLVSDYVLAQPILKSGFPIALPGSRNFAYAHGVNIADIAGDAKREIIIGSGRQVFVFDCLGQQLPGWPQSTTYYAVNTPAVGDLDGNGTLEIVASDRSWENNAARLYAWYGDGAPVPGFPEKPGTIVDGWYAPLLYELAGDTLAVIHVKGRVNFTTFAHEIYVYDHAGNLRKNFPLRLPGLAADQPALGDVHGDGSPDIITLAIASEESAYVHVTNVEGKSRSLWRKKISGLGSNINGPSLAELDRQPGLDILFTEYIREPPNFAFGAIHAIDGNGLYLPGFPVDSVNGQRLEPFNAGVAFADIDHDGVPEIFAAATDQFIGLRADGSALPGWPQKVFLGTGWSPSAYTPPTLGDIDRDGVIDIFTGDNHIENGRWGLWHVFDVTGARKSWSPFWVDGFTLTQAAFTDLEQDGALDIVFVSADTDSAPNYLWAYSMGPGTYDPSMLPWPQYGHDRYLTSQYGYVPSDIRVSVEEEAKIFPANFLLHQNYPNPFSAASAGQNNVTEIRYELSEPAEVHLRIFNLLGSEVQELISALQPAGKHKAYWNGCDREQQKLAPGLYFYRLEISPRSQRAGRVILIKKLLLL